MRTSFRNVSLYFAFSEFHRRVEVIAQSVWDSPDLFPIDENVRFVMVVTWVYLFQTV